MTFRQSASGSCLGSAVMVATDTGATRAEPVIKAVLPNANVPTSIRSSGAPVVHGSVSDLGTILDSWLAEDAGIACVIGADDLRDGLFRATSRVRSLTPELSKGLEFDLVVLIDPETFGTGIEGAVDRYVAMTRATQRLVTLTSPCVGGRARLPACPRNMVADD